MIGKLDEGDFDRPGTWARQKVPPPDGHISLEIHLKCDVFSLKINENNLAIVKGQ